MSHRSFFPYQTSHPPPAPGPNSYITSVTPVTPREAGQFLDDFLTNTLSSLYSHSSAGDSTLFHIGRLRDNLLGRVEKPSPPSWEQEEEGDEVEIAKEGFVNETVLRDELLETDVPSQTEDKTEKLSKKEARKREREEKKARRRSERNERLVSSLKAGNESGDVESDGTKEGDMDQSIEENITSPEIPGIGSKSQKRRKASHHERSGTKPREREGRKKEKSKAKHAEKGEKGPSS